MPDIIETVKIATKDFECGYLIINKSDFDDKSMKLYVEKGADAGDKKPAEGDDKDPKETKTGGKKGADAGATK